MSQITEWQQRVWDNKLQKGFSTTNVEQEFNLTYAELAEVYEAYRRGRSDIDEELADVQLFVLALAKMLGVDLEKAVEAKLTKNEKRVYEKQQNGHHVQKEMYERQ